MILDLGDIPSLVTRLGPAPRPAVEPDALPTGVDMPAHDLGHPVPMWGCPWCPQTGVCPQCELSASECPDPAGHRRARAGSEPALLTRPVG